MPVAVARKIEFFVRNRSDLDIQVQHVLLTHEQCVEFALPRTPIKESDGRAGRWAARHGEGATELDALEALHPGLLGRIVAEQLNRFLDDEVDTNIADVVREVEDELDEITRRVHERCDSAVVDQLRTELEEIEAYASAEIEELRVRIAAREEAIAPLIVELQAFAEQMSAELEREAPYVDEFDWPELPEADEFDDPLFDSRRDYIEQADRYREHKGEPEDVTLKRPSRRNDVTLG